MKINKIAISMVLAGLLLASAGTARADRDINIYGCSAEFFLWANMAPGFLADATNGAGCTSVQYAYDSAGTNYFLAKGTGCANFDNGGNVNIHVAYKTSNDAIWSVTGVADPEAVLAGTQCPAVNSMYYNRKMPTSFTTGSCTSNPTGHCVDSTTLTCLPVTMGGSDEKADYFTQISWGNKNGQLGGGTICRQFGDPSYLCLDGATAREPMPSETDSNGNQLLLWYNPIADPTAFYVNAGVTVRTCAGGTRAGDMCSDDTYCPSSSCNAAATIDNVSRMMAVQIFTGQVTNWQDFGAGFANRDIIACMRHTGAGTNITFDYDVIGNGHNWLPVNVSNMIQMDYDLAGAGTHAYFYDTIGDQLKCVNGVDSGHSSGQVNGAIGYTDADRSTGLSTYPHVSMVKYNGVLPSRRNMRNGLHDFWSRNYLYFNPSANSDNCPPASGYSTDYVSTYSGRTYTRPNNCSSAAGVNFQVFDKLVHYATDNPTTITGLSTNKGDFWAAIGANSDGSPKVNEMHYMRDHAPDYPYFVPSSQLAHPQTP